MKFCLGRTPSAPKWKDLGVTHRAVHSLLSRESWACNDDVCVPPARYKAANSRSGILSSVSGAVVVVDHAAQPLPALHSPELPRWPGSGLMSRFPRPHLVIEYAPQRDEPNNHVHSIYRDPANDYGRALTTK
jgi:hypothetical protein